VSILPLPAYRPDLKPVESWSQAFLEGLLSNKSFKIADLPP
jgi:hypothetical protein